MKAVIVGGGWSGCAAAAAAKKAGLEAAILERTDMLLGTGLVGGIMNNNGRLTASLEMAAMGAGDMFDICSSCARHENVDFPGHNHAMLYDIALIHGAVHRYLLDLGVDVKFFSRVKSLKKEGNRIKQVADEKGGIFEADVFIDATGTAGPMSNCSKYGNGCAMCILRCPSFGGRISLAGLAGAKEKTGRNSNGAVGAMSGSCKLHIQSLSAEIQEKLAVSGMARVPAPKVLSAGKLSAKACQQYALDEYKENLILLDTGHAKMMTPYMELESLRSVPGMENARYEDPYAGGVGNSMRYFDMAPRDDSLKVEGIDNLYCCGEKAGLLVGHTEAICTGALAGFNAAMSAFGKNPLVLPEELAVGFAIHAVREAMETPEGMGKKFTFSGSVLFEAMVERQLYSVNPEEIDKRVRKAGLFDAMAGIKGLA
ncbi:MAG: FAD-dependent oxidoreductase [Clostridiales bacterium]|nr:FAD-dependent oxidoreductase [Clostridiales bacterium]